MKLSQEIKELKDYEFNQLKDEITNKVEQLEQREKELIEYIKLLGQELSSIIPFMACYGWQSKLVKKGERQREKLEKLFNKKWEDIINE